MAVCDVRKGARDQAKGKVDGHYKNTDCQAYNDFRELLARTDIDAVHVATPDHWHAIMVIEACRNGKDVYCQKPETRTLREGPLMVEAARRYSRVVSGGSQRVLEDYRKTVDPCWGGELGTIKAINVNVGPLSQACNLPAEDVPPDMDWDLWLGPAPWAPYNKARCDGNFGTGGGSWRSYIDYSGGGMTDWGAHHFGGATFAVDVRELQPEEVIYNDENGKKYLTYRYPNGRLIHHNRPGWGNLQVEGTPGEKVPAKPVPSYKGNGRDLRRFHRVRQDPRAAVPRHRVGGQHRDVEPPGHRRLHAAAIPEMGRGQAAVPRRRGSQSLPRSRSPRAVAAVTLRRKRCQEPFVQAPASRSGKFLPF